MSVKKEKRSECPISYALDIFGDKWTLLIIRDLLLFGKHTFGEFVSSGEKIATNILANRLLLLEEEGIMSKEKDLKKGSRFIYRLTPKGVELLPIIVEIMKWSASHDPDTIVPQHIIEHATHRREDFLQGILDRMEHGEYLLPGAHGHGH